ncbi:DUF2235 domain-containing protein [Burkholderia sp. JSH-S8]|uniref:DUF2235 domain-containing protein n=1 Tax=Burkholderia stagnalis TaxID=1503054 RepID=UPI0009EBC8EF|nr:DUF2235 domain-containing protein [Burkholderia stagnalis]WGS46262.1 DUF2235 domain-containing protein [Burkholderia sp. JSH-S8]
MSKNIVLCLDGTWNGPDARSADGSGTPTNVQLVFENLKGSGPLGPSDDEREVSAPAGPNNGAQAAKYIHGVGDTSNVLARMVQGAVGLGLIARIVRGYTYLSRQYQPGDRIYIVGFSRGAYTARALAGFVARQGLLDWDAMQLSAESEASYSAGLAAWQQYKSSLHSGASGILHALADGITSLYDRFELGLRPSPPLSFVSDVDICTVGVWDTVGALGIPDIKKEDGTMERLDAFKFADNTLSDRVANGFQAFAIDEQRVDFTPSIWAPRDGVIQVLFPGAHADVGGGYVSGESGLPYGALLWMSYRLTSVGVLFERIPPVTANPLAIQHRPWASSNYISAVRHFPPGLRLSQRAVQRLLAGVVPVEKGGGQEYRPPNMVNSYVMPNWSGPAPHVFVES